MTTIIKKSVIFHKDVCLSRNPHLKLRLAPLQIQNEFALIHTIRAIRRKRQAVSIFNRHSQSAIIRVGRGDRSMA